MIIRDFLNWVTTAPDGPRAEAAGALARAWLYSAMSEEDRRGASAALMFLLDDPDITVRMAMAESLASSADAPLHVIRALSQDADAVAEPILVRSPLLSEDELVDAVAQSSDHLQAAVAGRRGLSAMVSAALAEVAGPDACLVLVQNRSASLLPSTLVRIEQRFGAVVAIRDALLDRTDLSLPLRHRLLQRIAEGLGRHSDVLKCVPEHQRAEFLNDATDKLTLRLAFEATDDNLPDLIHHLRDEGLLSTRLLLRAMCCGRLRFFVAALSMLGRVPPDRLRNILVSVRDSALHAVLRKAGLPLRSHQAFVLAIEVARQADVDFTNDLPVEVARNLTEAVLCEIQDGSLGADQDIAAFLRRFAVDAARLEARAFVSGSLQKALVAA